MIYKKITLLASGGGSLVDAVCTAATSGELHLDICRVISDRPAPVLELAQSYGIPTTLIDFSSFPDRLTWGQAIEEAVAKDVPDLVVSLGFMRILPPQFIERFATINTHPALLPLFPGAHAVRDALAAGVGVTGTTVHWVDAGVDTGKVISQIEVSVKAGDTEESLHERIKIEERKLIVETLKKYSEGLL